MSNALHHDATHYVAIALVPAFLLLGAALTWEMQPRSVASTDAARFPAWSLVVPAQPPVDVVVLGSVTQVSKPIAQAAAATATTAKVQYCEVYAMYASSTEKVRICHWM